MSLTGKLGEYLNDLDQGTGGLSALPVQRYERIFKVHTQAPTLPISNDKQFYYFNILNKLEFPLNIQSELLSTYNVKSREPFTTISYNLYKDIDSWWMIWYINKKELKDKFYAEGGTELQYILPGSRDLIYQQIVKYTVANNRHF
tara:strand:- start:1639 stop:2073 length:435 start_codon:yes stop_codon:yes gene_type:complete